MIHQNCPNQIRRFLPFRGVITHPRPMRVPLSGHDQRCRLRSLTSAWLIMPRNRLSFKSFGNDHGDVVCSG